MGFYSNKKIVLQIQTHTHTSQSTQHCFCLEKYWKRKERDYERREKYNYFNRLLINRIKP